MIKHITYKRSMMSLTFSRFRHSKCFQTTALSACSNFPYETPIGFLITTLIVQGKFNYLKKFNSDAEFTGFFNQIDFIRVN